MKPLIFLIKVSFLSMSKAALKSKLYITAELPPSRTSRIVSLFSSKHVVVELPRTKAMLTGTK